MVESEEFCRSDTRVSKDGFGIQHWLYFFDEIAVAYETLLAYYFTNFSVFWRFI